MGFLRPYQVEAVQNLRNAVGRLNKFSPLLQMPTGMGKTIVACEIIRSAVAKRNNVLVLVPRRQLVWQTVEKLQSFGVDCGIIMSGERPSMMPQVQVASVQTLYRRCFQDGEPVKSSFYGSGMPLPKADLIVIDESHANCSNMAQKIVAEYPDAPRIGMTATPCRADGSGLGHFYDAIIQGPSVRWAMDNGYLAELRYFGPSEWDMSEVKITAGDYNQKQLGEAVNKPKLVGDVVRNWERIAPDRTTVVFAVDRKHARALHEAFNGAGHVAEYIDGQTDNDERNAIFRRLELGESRVLCSVAVVDMGWDAPWAECAVLARPTKSLSRYLQSVGRILRPAPNKPDAILIDHTGAVQELGFVDDDFEWSLAGAKPRQKQSENREPSEETTVTCPGCHRVIRPGPQCPECGKELTSHSKRAIRAKEAELQEIIRKELNSKAKNWTQEKKAEFFGELKGYAKSKGYKKGWAVHAYKERLGVLPWPVYDTPTREPGTETRNWITSRNIRQAKKREKERATA